MSTSLIKRSPLPGVYGIPPYAYEGCMVLRLVPLPALNFVIACVQLDRAGNVVAVAKRQYGAALATLLPSVEVPFPVVGTAEYWAIGFAYTDASLPTEWPTVAVRWSIQG